MKDKQKITSLLQDTLLPSVHIDVIQEDTTCLQSKFGGVFYLPQGEQIPVCPEGEQMQFLAQINFAEIPSLPGFPKEGIVQFFLDTDEERFYDKNEDPESKRELYTVRYYPQPDAALQQNRTVLEYFAHQPVTTVCMGDERISLAEYEKRKQEKEASSMENQSTSTCAATAPSPTFENADLPGHVYIDWKNGKMQFEMVSEVATFYVGADLVADMGYQHVWEKLTPALVKKAGYDIENWEDDTDDFCWDFGNWGCKIGGHPAFKSFDERIDYEPYQPYETLLFQYDFGTREEFEADTFSFFIRPEDLADCRFDDVLLIWQNAF